MPVSLPLINPGFQPIDLREEDAESVQVVAEFITVLRGVA
jgi:hypothetical protein